jgi:hypothetical protein
MEKFNSIAGFNAASQEELTRIIEKDIPTLTKDAKVFKEENSDAYTILINTWLWLIADNASERSMTLVKNDMLAYGLVNTIARAADSNALFVSQLQVTDPTWCVVYEDIRAKYGYRDFGYGFIHPSRELTPDIFRAFNMLTKYAKRFTPVKAEKFEDSTWEAYISNQCEMEYSWTQGDTVARAIYVSEIRDCISNLLPWKTICDQIEEILNEPSIMPLTPGATATTSRRPLEKIRKMERFQTDPCEVRTKLNGEFIGRYDEMQGFNKALQVPKNYKSARVIAPEEFERASKGLAIYRVMERHLPVNIKIRDQRFNQILSLLGSAQERIFDTLDLSFASDSQTFMLFNELYPPRFTGLISKLLAYETRFPRPITVTYKGTRRKMTKVHAATAMAMGHPLTFIMECITFLCCCIVGAAYSGEDMSSKEKYTALYEYDLPNNGGSVNIPRILIVGDDIGVDSRFSEATEHILRSVGFKVNLDKSFTGSHPFRESCGKEYFKGIDVTPNYYPRSPIGALDRTIGVPRMEFNLQQGSTEPKDALSKLIEIQHRMCIWSYHANLFITAVIKAYCPDITESEVNSDNSDIWVSSPTVRRILSPYGFITEFYVQEDARERRKYIPREEVHTSIESVCEETDWSIRAKEHLSNAIALYRKVVGRLTFEEAKSTCYSYLVERVTQAYKEYTHAQSDRPVHHICKYTTAAGQRVFKDSKSHLVRMDGHEESYLESHTTPVATWNTDYVLTPKDEVALTNFCYQNWLQYGPQYRSSADTLEGIIERNCGITYNPYRTDKGSFRKLLYGDCSIIWRTK